MHIHTAPDIRERRYTDFDLARAAVRVGARAAVIKSHHGATMNRAYLANLHVKETLGAVDFTMIGSVTLNRAIGGLNPAAVDTAFKMGAKVVWLPTVHSVNHQVKHGKTGGIVCVENNHAVEPLREIFRIVRDNDGVLGTGHLAPDEIRVVVADAKNAGLDKIVVTHPEFWVVGMPLEEQARLAREYDVYFERTFAQPMGGGVYKSNLDDNVAAVREVGYRNILVSTDGGQVENPPWEEAHAAYTAHLLDNGIPEEQVAYMTRELPSRLLGL